MPHPVGAPRHTATPEQPASKGLYMTVDTAAHIPHCAASCSVAPQGCAANGHAAPVSCYWGTWHITGSAGHKAHKQGSGASSRKGGVHARHCGEQYSITLWWQRRRGLFSPSRRFCLAALRGGLSCCAHGAQQRLKRLWPLLLGQSGRAGRGTQAFPHASMCARRSTGGHSYACMC
jgi:hypothetical protein